AWPAARPRREVARDDGDARVRRDVRHVQSAEADDARFGSRRRPLHVLVGGGRGRRRPGRRHLARIALLELPAPFDFALSTGRFQAFGTDFANRFADGVLHRAIGGRDVSIAAANGGVEVDPLDDETRPVVMRLLGAPFDLNGFYDWAAGPMRTLTVRL